MVKVGMVSLGCSKNQVDGERLLALLGGREYQLCADPAQCQVVIINTCGFIEDAKQESIDTILEFAQEKGRGSLRCIVVTGCLAERYREELAKEIPEADVVLGIGKNHEIASAIERALAGERVLAFGAKEELSLEGERVLANPPYFAYIKVAEGCDNRCSYCAIPLIRGGFRSRPMENILEEVRGLAVQGVREINLVAQDTSRYGLDLYGKYKLPELIREVCKIDGVRWVRILYCYPERITDELIQTMAEEPKVVKYIDLPVQHGSGKVLREMNRQGDRESILQVLRRIRAGIPGVVIRTTMIAGFPGETEEDFLESLEFAKDIGFSRIHVFPYSRRPGTRAAQMPSQVPQEEKRRRAARLIAAGEELRKEFLAQMVGTVQEVLFEEGGAQGQTGYTPNYTPVTVQELRPLQGQVLPVRLTSLLGEGCGGCL